MAGQIDGDNLVRLCQIAGGITPRSEITAQPVQQEERLSGTLPGKVEGRDVALLIRASRRRSGTCTHPVTNVYYKQHRGYRF